LHDGIGVRSRPDGRRAREKTKQIEKPLIYQRQLRLFSGRVPGDDLTRFRAQFKCRLGGHLDAGRGSDHDPDAEEGDDVTAEGFDPRTSCFPILGRYLTSGKVTRRVSAVIILLLFAGDCGLIVATIIRSRHSIAGSLNRLSSSCHRAAWSADPSLLRLFLTGCSGGC
jgi:hypothetical protein